MNFGDEFHDKRVVITGAAGIMGKALVKAFLDAGAQVCLTDQNIDTLSIANENGFVVEADLTKDEGLQKLLDEVKAKWGAPDVLINNAAIYPSSFLLDMSVADWDQIMSVNVRAPFVLMRGFCLQMIDVGVHGNVINISSGAARKMRRTAVTYCMSKTALDRMTKGFALEVAEFGIRVNILEPGFATGSTVSTLTQEHVNRVMAAIPLGIQTAAEDVGQSALFLASDAAKNITGTSLAVDGGNSAGTMDVFQDKKHPL
jgi:3-oxoacyl-[acyl-carrier protein] reductase